MNPITRLLEYLNLADDSQVSDKVFAAAMIVVLLVVLLPFISGCGELETLRIEPRSAHRSIVYRGKLVQFIERWDWPGFDSICAPGALACGRNEAGQAVVYRKTMVNDPNPDPTGEYVFPAAKVAKGETK